jgi:hypothetical protein
VLILQVMPILGVLLLIAPFYILIKRWRTKLRLLFEGPEYG